MVDDGDIASRLQCQPTACNDPTRLIQRPPVNKEKRKRAACILLMREL